jgi:hypothetical protein
VGNPPAFLIGVRGKQTVVDCLTDFDNGAGHTFLKPSLIADLLKQFCAGDEDNIVAKDSDFENWVYWKKGLVP